MSTLIMLIVIAIGAYLTRNHPHARQPKRFMTKKDWEEYDKKKKEEEREFRKMMRDIK